MDAAKIKRLDSGYLRAQGNGPCEWAQWPEGTLPKQEHFFPEASEKFRRELLRQLESMDAAEREESMETKIGDKLKNVPGQYKHRASYDFLNGMFKVCAGGFCIAECEDSEVADAICLMWNADLRPADKWDEGRTFEQVWDEQGINWLPSPANPYCYKEFAKAFWDAALRISEPEPQVWPICKWCLTDLERWVRQSGKCPACGAIDWMEQPAQPETRRCATHGTLMVKRELGYYCDKCQPETGAVRYPQRATHCEKISEEDAAKAIAAAQKQIRKIEDAHIRRAWEQPDAVRELPEKWEKEWPLSESMDHCYAINAHAVHACAAELRAALSREEKQP